MSTRKNTKFNKNNGYKDFTFSIPKQNVKVYNKITHSRIDDFSENSISSNIDAPHKE